MPVSPDFSHIYIEKTVRNHTNTHRILEKYPHAIVLEIEDYKEIFNRPGSNFQAQKKYPKLILARKKDHFLYQGNERINSFGRDLGQLFYNSHIRNCLYNCDYCFLQGMHPSAHTVIFVNTDDFFPPLESVLNKGPAYLSLSYLTDILSYEELIPVVQSWMEYAKDKPDLTLEVRTKGEDLGGLSSIKPIENMLLVWSLTPQQLVRKYEKGTASLQGRLMGARKAIDLGWKVSFCLDPVLLVPGWEREYRILIEKIFQLISEEEILGVSVGAFRLAKDYLHRIRKMREDSDILFYPFSSTRGELSYPDINLQEMKKVLYGELVSRLGRKKIHFVGPWGS